jgi:hypothetical protein
MMPVKTTKNDHALVKLLGEFKILTVSQLASQENRDRLIIFDNLG